jgi:hypothetical protein
MRRRGNAWRIDHGKWQYLGYAPGVGIYNHVKMLPADYNATSMLFGVNDTGYVLT